MEWAPSHHNSLDYNYKDMVTIGMNGNDWPWLYLILLIPRRSPG